jgi:hypothetical protein
MMRNFEVLLTDIDYPTTAGRPTAAELLTGAERAAVERAARGRTEAEVAPAQVELTALRKRKS